MPFLRSQGDAEQVATPRSWNVVSYIEVGTPEPYSARYEQEVQLPQKQQQQEHLPQKQGDDMPFPRLDQATPRRAPCPERLADPPALGGRAWG